MCTQRLRLVEEEEGVKQCLVSPLGESRTFRGRPREEQRLCFLMPGNSVSRRIMNKIRKGKNASKPNLAHFIAQIMFEIVTESHCIRPAVNSKGADRKMPPGTRRRLASNNPPRRVSQKLFPYFHVFRESRMNLGQKVGRADVIRNWRRKRGRQTFVMTNDDSKEAEPRRQMDATFGEITHIKTERNTVSAINLHE